MNKFKISCVAAVLGLMPVLASAEIAVIVNASYGAGSASPDDIAKVFLAKSSSLPGGGALVPVDQADGSGTRANFYKKVAGKDAAQMNAYWSKLIFTGQGQPPKAVGGDSDVVGLVSKNPNMIGYVNASAVGGGVKVIAKVAD